MRDGEWKEALNFIQESLEGISVEQCISILDGESKLTGMSPEVLMEPEDAVVRQVLSEDYAIAFDTKGLVRFKKNTYRPYLVVTSLGTHDCSFIGEDWRLNHDFAEKWMHFPESVNTKSAFPKVFPSSLIEKRALFYAVNPKTDLSIFVANELAPNVVVLFELLTQGSIPFWYKAENKDFIKAYLAVSDKLPEGGHFVDHPGYMRFNPVSEPVLPMGSALSVELQNEETEKAQADAIAESARHTEFLNLCVELRANITEYANADTEYGWYTYHWTSTLTGTPSLTLKAPKRALFCYALSKAKASHLMPDYDAISPPDMKLSDDNPFHTDVWLGCGFAIDDKTYDRTNPHYIAVLDMMYQVQKEFLNFEVQVLAHGPEVYGEIVFPGDTDINQHSILVIPHAGVEFELDALKAGAIICEIGGKLAHLVTVCREMSKAILRMPDASVLLKKGQRATVNSAKGTLQIHP